MAKKIAVFRAGSYPQATVTVQELQQSVKAYDPNLFRAPLTTDHQQAGPAFGWFDKFWMEGEELCTELNPGNLPLEGFAEIQSGRWGPPSVELYHPDNPSNPVPGTRYIKAVTMLGAKPPAVKGLDPVRFSEAERKALNDRGSLDGVLIFDEVPPDLDALNIAVPGTVWDAEAAFTHIKERFGWWGVSEYVLYRDWEMHYDDPAAYHGLVVDIVANEPMLVPAAVDAAAAAIKAAPGKGEWVQADKDAAYSRVKSLKDQISKAQTGVGFGESGPHKPGGSPVDRAKLIKFVTDLAKGKIPDSDVAAFAEAMADGVFKDNPKFAEFSEQSALTFAQTLFQAKLEAFEAKAETLAEKAKTAKFAEEQRSTAIATRVAEFSAKGKIPAKQKDRVIAFAATLPADAVMTFSEGGKQVQRSLLDEFFAIFAEVVPDKSFTPPAGEHNDDGGSDEFGEHRKAGNAIAGAVNPSKE